MCSRHSLYTHVVEVHICVLNGLEYESAGPSPRVAKLKMPRMGPLTNLEPHADTPLSDQPQSDPSWQQRTDISTLGLDCQKQFKDLIDSLLRPGIGEGDGDLYDGLLSIAIVPIKEELGRFRTWANNIGAVTSGRGSLEYRVRGAEYLRHNVKSSLESLRTSLIYGTIAIYHTELQQHRLPVVISAKHLAASQNYRRQNRRDPSLLNQAVHPSHLLN